MCDVHHLPRDSQGHQGSLLDGQEDTQKLVSQVTASLQSPIVKEIYFSCRVYERDVFMSREHCMDLKERLGANQVNLPQVFIHGHLLGVSLRFSGIYH